MITKPKPVLPEYTEMLDGTYETESCIIRYRFSRPVYLALIGDTAALEKLTRRGLPPSGVSPEILRRLPEPMELAWEVKEEKAFMDNEFSIIDESLFHEGFEQLDISRAFPATVFRTTAEAAMAGGQSRTFFRLLEQGMKIDLRCERLLQVFYHCEDKDIIRFVLEHPETHYEMLDYHFILHQVSWNLPLIEALYDKGIRPPASYLQAQIFPSLHGMPPERENMKRRNDVLRSPLGKFLLEKGYRDSVGLLDDAAAGGTFFTEQKDLKESSACKVRCEKISDIQNDDGFKSPY